MFNIFVGFAVATGRHRKNFIFSDFLLHRSNASLHFKKTLLILNVFLSEKNNLRIDASPEVFLLPNSTNELKCDCSLKRHRLSLIIGLKLIMSIYCPFYGDRWYFIFVCFFFICFLFRRFISATLFSLSFTTLCNNNKKNY